MRPYALTNGVSATMQFEHVCHISIKIDNKVLLWKKLPMNFGTGASHMYSLCSCLPMNKVMISINESGLEVQPK